jgi:hypothetical protein
MNTRSMPGHSKSILPKFSLIVCEILHLVGIKILSLCTRKAFYIMLTFTLKRSVNLFTLLHLYTNIQQEQYHRYVDI